MGHPEPCSCMKSAWLVLCTQLVDPAVGRSLVVAEPEELGAVADAAAAHMVEGHLDHELGAKRAPLAVFRVGLPPVRLGGAPFARLIRGDDTDQLARALRREPRGVPDRPEAIAVVEAEDERADGALRLPRPPAEDDAVDRADPLHLDHPDALAGPVRGVRAL